MAAIAVDGGSGSTQNPLNLTAPKDKINGQNASANWWNKYVSDYNKPSSIPSSDYFAQQTAARRNAEILAQAQERERERQTKRLMEETAAQPVTEPIDPYSPDAPTIFGAPLSGPLGRAALSAGQFLSDDPLEKVGDWLTSPAPNFNIKTDPQGNPIDPTAEARAAQLSRTRGPEKPGYYQQPVLNKYGETIGYEYIPFVKPSPVTIEEATIATQNDIKTTESPMLKSEMAATIYDETTALENSYASRRYAAAVRMWGEPIKEKNPDGSEKLVWGTNGKEYLGMAPGEIASPTLRKPKADAPYSEWVKYRDRLRAQQNTLNRIPYTESSVKEAYYSMGTKGIKEMQRAFLRAGLYDENDVVSLGNVGKKELSFMTDLMTLANINGTTWEEQFAIFQEAAKEKARTQGGGGGGGGGGGTSVYTQVQYTQTSMAQGRSLLISVLKDALGRYPTDDEIARFIDMLNKAESKSPTTTVTRTTKDGSASRSVARTTPSDVDAQAMAEEFAQSIGGGAPAEANMNDRYIGALLKSLGGTSV